MFAHKRKLFASGLAACAVFVCLTACGKEQGTEQPAEGTESGAVSSHLNASGKKIGLSFPAAAEGSTYAERAAFLESLFKAEGCEVITLFANEAEVEAAAAESASSSLPAAEDGEEPAGQAAKEGQQTKDVASLIGSSCDILVIFPDGKSSLGSVLQRAKEANIPVISYDGLIEGSDAVTCYVAVDSYRMGRLQGEYLAASLGLGTAEHSKLHTIEFVAGLPSDYRSGYIFNGAYDVLQPYFDAGTLSVPSGEISYSKVSAYGEEPEAVKERLTGIFRDFYGKSMQPDAVLCPSDSAAGGAIAAVESVFGGKSKVSVTGAGASKDALSLIGDGKQAMTLYWNPEWEADVTRDVVLTILDGDPADASLIRDGGWEFGCTYDTASYDNGTGIIPSFLISPQTITKANMSEVQQKKQ